MTRAVGTNAPGSPSYRREGRAAPTKAADWDLWRHIPIARIWQAVALSLDREPGDDPPYLDSDSQLEEWARGRFPADFVRRLKIATAQAGREGPLVTDMITFGNGGRAGYGTEVRLVDFGAWAAQLGLDLPDAFPRVAPAAQQPPSGSPRWPWGSHETELLRHLARAAELWKPMSEGGNYDPNDIDTAPTNAQVEARLEKLGVSKRVREVIAQILRADGVRTGPR